MSSRVQESLDGDNATLLHACPVHGAGVGNLLDGRYKSDYGTHLIAIGEDTPTVDTLEDRAELRQIGNELVCTGEVIVS